ncbi:hypothetical protein RND81_14G130600 [Saponaria officinalis]|uniref:Oleosin n=1 Tax=Saponaria officinalis TaxID=3572 RepID=A0AAW1GLJ4_SAPOF
MQHHTGSGQGQHYGQHNRGAHNAVKAAMAATAGGSLLVLSGLTLAGTVIALTMATPLLVIFSPVLVPAAITVTLLTVGFLASGGFGITAVSVLAWVYRLMTERHPPGTDQLEMARMKLAGKGKDVTDTAQHYGQQTATTTTTTTGGRHTT